MPARSDRRPEEGGRSGPRCGVGVGLCGAPCGPHAAAPWRLLPPGLLVASELRSHPSVCLQRHPARPSSSARCAVRPPPPLGTRAVDLFLRLAVAFAPSLDSGLREEGVCFVCCFIPSFVRRAVPGVLGLRYAGFIIFIIINFIIIEMPFGEVM